MKNFRSMAYPYVVWAFVLIVIPMLMIAMYAFTERGNSVITFRLTLDNFKVFFSDAVFINIMKRSFYIALVTTVICILLGYPAAYIAANLGSEKNRMMMVILITIPTWINMLVRTYAWLGILQDNGLINSALRALGLPAIKIIQTDFAVIFGMVYNFIPFMILQIYTSLTKMDKSYIEAAQDLGANRLQSFIKITLPLSLPGIISGITLVFLPAVSSFFIPKLLGGGKYVLIGNVIENQFLTAGNWNFGSALSLIMAVIIVFLMWLTKKADRDPNAEGGL